MTEKKKFTEKRTRMLAIIGFLFVTIIWGSSFVVTKTSMDVISPTYLLAYRFSIAAVGLVLIFWKQVETMTWFDIRLGSMLGILLFISYYFQTYGLKYTTASKNAFITTLYVIIVPFLHWGFNKVKPRRNNMIAAVIAVVGLALISLKGDLTVNYGDILTLICGFFYGLHMVLLGKYTASCNPIKLTVLQMAVAGICSWIVALTFEGSLDLRVFADTGILISILYLGVIASMFCFFLQTVGQTYLSPNTTSILLSFESVFGLLFSVIFLKELVTGRMLLGCVLMLAAAILSEYTPSKAKKDINVESGVLELDATEYREERDIDGEVFIHS